MGSAQGVGFVVMGVVVMYGLEQTKTPLRSGRGVEVVDGETRELGVLKQGKAAHDWNM